jgi:flagellar biosynthesis chaperone FliJ
MIKLNEQEAAQVTANVEAVIFDLQNAVFGNTVKSDLEVGARVGIALQKLEDLRSFLHQNQIKDITRSMSAKEEHMKQMSTSADSWIERQTREEKIYQAINEKLKKNVKP